MHSRPSRLPSAQRLKHTLGLILVLALLALPAPAAAADKAQQIDKLITAYHDLGIFNGSALVAENGKVILKKGYGLAHMEWDIPNQPDTKFRLGSITKQFTAMLILQQVDAGKLRLDGSISDYLPYYRADTGGQITLHHLLTHTSGLPPYHTAQPNFFRDASRDLEVQEFVEKYCSGDLEFEPGAEWNYSFSGYFLLGAILEQVAGETYEALLQERIFDPLGMADSGYDHHDTILPNRAAGYQKSLADIKNAPYLDMSLLYSVGSLYSTVEDLYRWDQALYANKLLSAELMEKFFTPYKNNYAYGWFVRKISVGEKDEERTTIGHWGGINGFHTLITRIVDDRHLIVLLNNTGDTRLAEMSRGITNILYGKLADPPKRSIAEALLKIVGEKGVEVAVEQYQALKKTQADYFDFRESELNRLAYFLLGEKKIPEALAIFQLNVEAYPESSNVYDSLGEAYMENGEVELAIKNYAKSLGLNPKNTNAIEKLNKLREM